MRRRDFTRCLLAAPIPALIAPQAGALPIMVRHALIGTGGGSSYTATHYVAPYASAAGSPSSDEDVQDATAWSNAANSNTPCTLACAMANADAGDVVRVGPGVYTATDANADGYRWIPLFAPTNSGSEGSPIIFFAQYPAAYHEGETALLTELRRTGNPAPRQYLQAPIGNGEGNDYIIFDGFFFDEDITGCGDGVGYVQVHVGDNCEIRRCLIDRGTTDYELDGGYNANPIRLDAAINTRVVDCKIINGLHLQNTNWSGIETYNTIGTVIEHCHFRNTGSPLYIKGVLDLGSPYATQDDCTIRYNKIESCYLGISMQSCLFAEIHHNEIECTSGGVYQASQQGPYFTPLNEDCDLLVHHNTIVRKTTAAGLGASQSSAGFGFQDLNRHSALTEYHSNLIYTASDNTCDTVHKQEFEAGRDWDDIGRFDYNVYYDAGTPAWVHESNTETDIGDWKTYLAASWGPDSYGNEYEEHSQHATITFVDLDGGDYRLVSNGQAALTGAVGGGVAGCYVTGNEEIGLRASPSY